MLSNNVCVNDSPNFNLYYYIINDYIPKQQISVSNKTK